MVWRITVEFCGSSLLSEKLAALNRFVPSMYGRARPRALQPPFQNGVLPVPASTIEGGKVPTAVS